MNYKSTMTDMNNLYDAHLKSVKASKWKESTQRYMWNFLPELVKLHHELDDMTYIPSKENEFILNERDKIRPITSLRTRDRIVRHVLCDNILTPQIRRHIIYDNGASIEKRGLSFTRKRFEVHLRDYIRRNKTNEGYILLGDFSKFYDNIPHDQAKDQLLQLCNYDEYIAWLLDVIFKSFRLDCSRMSLNEFEYYKTHPINRAEYRDKYKSTAGLRYLDKGVNIGDQLSQDIGIYYPHTIDNYVKIVCGMKYYARYMDDFYVISPSREKLLDILNGIKREATSLGLFLNLKKTRIVRLDKPFRYLQVRYTTTPSGKIFRKINPKTPTRLRNKLKDLAANPDIPYGYIESMFKSSMGNDAPWMTRYQRENLIDLYERLFNVEINIQNGKMDIRRIQ